MRVVVVMLCCSSFLMLEGALSSLFLWQSSEGRRINMSKGWSVGGAGCSSCRGWRHVHHLMVKEGVR